MSDSPSSNVDTQNGADETYPEQHHAGKVGYGPNYHMGPTLGDKIAGYTEELHGKIVHKPQLVKEGHDRATGETKRRERLGLDEESPFTAHQEAEPQKPENPQTVDSLNETGDSLNGSERVSIESKSSASSKSKEKSSTVMEDDM